MSLTECSWQLGSPLPIWELLEIWILYAALWSSWYWCFWNIFSAALWTPGPWNHLFYLVWSKGEGMKPLPVTDWTMFLSVLETMGQLDPATSWLRDSRQVAWPPPPAPRFSGPGYHSAPTAAVVEDSTTQSLQSTWQIIRAPWMVVFALLLPLLPPPSWTCGGPLRLKEEVTWLSWKWRGGWEYSQKLVKGTSYLVGCF